MKMASEMLLVIYFSVMLLTYGAANDHKPWTCPFKDKVDFWSCNCIVKETLWNRSEKVDHLAYKYWCVLQGSGIIKMIRNLAQSW